MSIEPLHLLAACPDHPVCGQEHPFDPSIRCLRRDCVGVHCADGTDPWREGGLP